VDAGKPQLWDEVETQSPRDPWMVERLGAFRAVQPEAGIKRDTAWTERRTRPGFFRKLAEQLTPAVPQQRLVL
jgi:hypothetical protein